MLTLQTKGLNMKEAKQEDIINELQRKIESWRATKTYRAPIPNQLWQAIYNASQDVRLSCILRKLKISTKQYQNACKKLHLDKSSHIDSSSFVELNIDHQKYQPALNAMVDPTYSLEITKNNKSLFVLKDIKKETILEIFSREL